MLPPSTLDQAGLTASSSSVGAGAQPRLKHGQGAYGLQGNKMSGTDPIFTIINGDAGPPLGEADTMSLDATPINWGQWDNMCQEFEMGQLDAGIGTLDMFPPLH